MRNHCGKPTDYSYVNRIYDTACLTKAAILDIKAPDDPRDNLAWQYKLYHYVKRGLKSGIQGACKFFDITYDEGRHHDATYDIQITFDIFKKTQFALDLK